MRHYTKSAIPTLRSFKALSLADLKRLERRVDRYYEDIDSVQEERRSVKRQNDEIDARNKCTQEEKDRLEEQVKQRSKEIDETFQKLTSFRINLLERFFGTSGISYIGDKFDAGASPLIEKHKRLLKGRRPANPS